MREAVKVLAVITLDFSVYEVVALVGIAVPGVVRAKEVEDVAVGINASFLILKRLVSAVLRVVGRFSELVAFGNATGWA